MKHICTLLLVIQLIATAHLSPGQSDKKLHKKYLYGLELLDQRKFEPAVIIFDWVISKGDESMFAKPSTYLKALANYRSGDLQQAKSDLLRLKSQHPKWAMANEVNFLLGIIYLDELQPIKAFDLFSAISDTSLIEDIKNAKIKKLTRLPIDSLVALYQKTGDEISGTLAYHHYLQMHPDNRINSPYRALDSLFRNSPYQKYKRLRNDVRVAVLMPFKAAGVLVGDQPTQIVYDTYEGIQMAVDSLLEEGINVKLFSYDTEGDSAKTAEILAQPGMENMDFFIGPLSRNTRGIASQFCHQHNIPMINPLATSMDWVAHPKITFLTNPTDTTVSKTAAKLALKYFDSKHAYIVYGTSRLDSLRANVHARVFKELGGAEVSLYCFDVSEKNSQRKYAFPRLKTELSSAPFDSAAHIYIASEDPVLARNVISAIQMHSVHRPLMVHSEWLDIRQIKYQQLEQVNAHILYPHYLNVSRDSSHQSLKWAFAAKTNMIPTNNAPYLGFEMTYFFTKSVLRYANPELLLERLRKEGRFMGVYLPGFDFRSSVDNHFVPMIKFVGGYPMMVNSVLFDE